MLVRCNRFGGARKCFNCGFNVHNNRGWRKLFMRFRSRIMSRERCEINSCLFCFHRHQRRVCSAFTILWNHNRLAGKQFPYLFQIFHSFSFFATFKRKCFSFAVSFDVALQKMSKSSIECTPLFRWTRIREVNSNMLLRLWAAELFHVEHFSIFSCVHVHETLHQDASEQQEQGRKDHNQKSLIPLGAGENVETTDVVNVKRPELRSKLARWNLSFDSLSELFVKTGKR